MTIRLASPLWMQPFHLKMGHFDQTTYGTLAPCYWAIIICMGKHQHGFSSRMLAQPIDCCLATPDGRYGKLQWLMEIPHWSLLCFWKPSLRCNLVRILCPGPLGRDLCKGSPRSSSLCRWCLFVWTWRGPWVLCPIWWMVSPETGQFTQALWWSGNSAWKEETGIWMWAHHYQLTSQLGISNNNNAAREAWQLDWRGYPVFSKFSLMASSLRLAASPWVL